ncbi:MAG TPA: hypothetical protein VEX37_07700, partial [Thermomicrobiales bacterium]|nr:hypothetical protein [Thermomicrobiales bacterium]
MLATIRETYRMFSAMELSLLTQHDWPQQLLTWIEKTHGAPSRAERLAGMSLNGVWRVLFDDASVIVKAGASENESRFYERVAPSMRAAGIPIPALYLTHHEPERHWLVIEDIPTPLPIPSAGDWQPDERIVAILARLHATTRAEPPDLPEQEPHRWDPDATSAALNCLKPNDAAA